MTDPPQREAKCPPGRRLTRVLSRGLHVSPPGKSGLTACVILGKTPLLSLSPGFLICKGVRRQPAWGKLRPKSGTAGEETESPVLFVAHTP